jgi:hypothetical protein
LVVFLGILRFLVRRERRPARTSLGSGRSCPLLTTDDPRGDERGPSVGRATDAIPVVIDGQPLGEVAVDDILPPPIPAAEGQGA